VRWRRILAVVVPVVLLASGGLYMMGMPGRSHAGPLPPLDPEEAEVADRLRLHVAKLAAEIGPRHVHRPRALAEARDYIAAQLGSLGYPLSRQTYEVAGLEVTNVEAEQRGREHPDRILVVGAHYDSVPGCPAANDNGSGVAGLLEVARLLAGRAAPLTVRFVAFVNEEPPWFQTERMGSLVYARAAKERGDDLAGMISLETIGYYSDEPGSQSYPFPFSLFYPRTGNFIAVVGNVSSRGLVRRCVGAFREHARFPCEGAAVPGWIPGIGWSDHWSFWKVGCPAVMFTDTAPFRYPEYHSPRDTPERIDYERTARVVVGIARVVEELSRAG
jgi:acetylornithine deacetylase/succinyl-diaminopimelate desuccinylase-like protein